MEWRRMIYQGNDLGDYYLISDQGEILGVKTHHIRKQSVSSKGYMICVISLGCRKRKICVRVHKAVAETFIPNPENKPEVNHLDGNKSNNSVNNLEWISSKGNTAHSVEIGLRHPIIGEKNGSSKLSATDVVWARSVYTPRSKEYGLRALSRRFGVDHSTMKSALSGNTWNNI